MKPVASLKKNNFMPNIISIPTPCHEDWNDMTPKEQGRHCGSCCKTVVDFTTWQPQEILLHFKSNKNVCGRFTADQLNEPIPTQEDFVKQISYFNISTVKKVAAIFLFAFMIGASSCNVNHTTGEMVAINVDSPKNINPVDITEIIAGGVITYPIIDTPPRLMGAPAIIHKPVVVEKPMIKGDVEIVERPVLMGEPAIVEQPTLLGDTVIQNTSEKLPECKPVKVKETEFVMGKIATPKAAKAN
jgi:hypothetical protein